MKHFTIRKTTAYLFVALVVALITAAITALLVDVFEKKQQAKNPYLRLVEIGEDDVDPAKWAVNWPREYDGYRRNSEPTATKYGGGLGGSESELPMQKAARDPWLSRLFAGYLFSVDYRDRRGHAFMLQDQELTKRNVRAEAKQSGNCLHCHASVMPLYRSLGREALPNAAPWDQTFAGFQKVGEMNYWDAHDMLSKITNGAHPVSCVDCHDPKTMELRVTRPGFIQGIQKLAASSAETPHLPSIEKWRSGTKDRPYDPNQEATRQEMRSYVCGQCHVEYFCGKGTTLFFPWDQGLKAEQIEQTYNGMVVKGEPFRDWVHAETGMPVLKAQHPEFEIWSQGIHARSGVACADCHMPYKREGALKVSEHWVRSPLLGLNRACQTCHPYPEKEIQARVETIQDRHYALLTRAGNASVAMLDAIVPIRKKFNETHRAKAEQKAKEAIEKVATSHQLDPKEREKKYQEEVKSALKNLWMQHVRSTKGLSELAELQRAAQWRLDFVAAENSMGFHAPQEMARILAESIDLSRQAEVKAEKLIAQKQ